MRGLDTKVSLLACINAFRSGEVLLPRSRAFLQAWNSPLYCALFLFMQLVGDIYARKAAAGEPVISFEFFPPKTDEGDRALLEKTLPALLRARPDYCSVTYGAGGSTRSKTLMIVDQIQRKHGLTAVAHLTCVCATREQIEDLLGQIRSLGVRNVLALRGDPPGGGEFQPTPGGFEFSSQLVEFIRQKNEIGRAS